MCMGCKEHSAAHSGREPFMGVYCNRISFFDPRKQTAQARGGDKCAAPCGEILLCADARRENFRRRREAA